MGGGNTWKRKYCTSMTEGTIGKGTSWEIEEVKSSACMGALTAGIGDVFVVSFMGRECEGTW